MGKKIILALASFIFTTQSATAAISDGSAMGILPMLQQLIGVEITNPGVAIGTAAAFGLMVALVYSVLKLGAEKLELAESLTGGGRHSEGRNMLLIISVLVGLSTLGTGFFGTLVNAYGLISILMVLVIGIIAFVAIGSFLTSGASGASKFASGAGKELQAQGMEAEAGAKEMKANAEKRKAQADKKMAELKEEAKQIREDIDKGDDDSEREAVEIEEDILNKVQEIVSNINLEDDIKMAEQALEELEEALKLEGTADEAEGPKLGYASARINRANAYLKTVKNEIIDNIDTSSGGSVPADQFIYADILRQTPAAKSGAGAELVLDDASGGMGSVRNAVLSQVQNNSANGKITFPGSHSKLGPDELGGIEQSTRKRVKSDIGGGSPIDFSGQTWDYGICEAHEDLDKARKQLKAVGKGVEEEDELEGDAFKKVVEAVEDIKLVHNLVGELHELLGELENDDEMLEKLAQDQNWKDLFEEVEADEDSVEDLDDYLDHLKDLEKKAIPILEEVHETLEGFIDLDEKEIQRLDDDKRLIGEIVTLTTGGSDGGLENKFNEIENALRSMSTTPVRPEQGAALSELINLSSNISDECQTILNELDAVENIDKREDSEARDMLHELEEIVG